MAVWRVTAELDDAEGRRAVLRDLRARPGIEIRDVARGRVVVTVEAQDGREAAQAVAPLPAFSVHRVDGGWSGDWWDGPPLSPGKGDRGPDGLTPVPFHHALGDPAERTLVLLWNGLSACEPGGARVDERDDAVIVTVYERRLGDVVTLGGTGRRTTVELARPLGARPVCDRRREAVRPTVRVDPSGPPAA